MQKVNQLFNKEVINQVTGARMDSVQDVILDSSLRNVVALVIGKAGPFQTTYVARWKTVNSIGDVVVLNSDDQLPKFSEEPEIQDLKKQAISITGTPVINANGENLGTVSDIFINEHGEVTGYAVKPGVLQKPMLLSIEYVQASGKDAIIATSIGLSELIESESEQPSLMESEQEQPTLMERETEQPTLMESERDQPALMEREIEQPSLVTPSTESSELIEHEPEQPSLVTPSTESSELIEHDPQESPLVTPTNSFSDRIERELNQPVRDQEAQQTS